MTMELIKQFIFGTDTLDLSGLGESSISEP